ncbi:MAG: hypothetical protein KH347_04455 [Acetobacter sp.]|nr:hypothetical protein [Acetobacter sp.]
MKKLLVLLLLLTGCRLPSESGAILKADAYSGEIPTDKTAILRLQNRIIRENSLEYRQFYPKVAELLKQKGYRIVDKTAPHAVVIKLYFGVQKTNYLRGRYSIGTTEELPFSDDALMRMLSVYKKINLYSKFLRVIAVDAKNPKRELWKIKIVKEDEAEDFRSAQYELLYFVQNISPAQTDLTAYLPMELKSDYAKYLQEIIRANPQTFAACGIKSPVWARFEVSPFGTLNAFETNAAERDCLANALESLLPAPVGVPEHETYTVTVP